MYNIREISDIMLDKVRKWSRERKNQLKTNPRGYTFIPPELGKIKWDDEPEQDDILYGSTDKDLDISPNRRLYWMTNIANTIANDTEYSKSDKQYKNLTSRMEKGARKNKLSNTNTPDSEARQDKIQDLENRSGRNGRISWKGLR